VLAEGGHLRLVYQPRIDLRTLQASSVEALVRWVHPSRGTQMPDAFIALAEQTGDILEIGAWVLDEAVRQLSRWRRSWPTLQVAINVSPVQIDRGTLLPALQRALRRHCVKPSSVEIEVTESLCVQDEVGAAGTMRALRSLGVHLAIDDFGKGCAGIATLRWLPATVVKLDKSLVDALHGDAGPGHVLVSALVAFAHGLGALCVAEGVETRAQVEALRRLGCDQAQGYFFSRPVEVGDIRQDYCTASPCVPVPNTV